MLIPSEKQYDANRKTFRYKAVGIIGLIFINIFGILVLEVGVRAWQGVPLMTTDNFIIQQLDIIRQNTGVMEFDTVLGWRLKDNLYAKGSGFTTGPFGLRMNSNEIRQPALGGILAVGDSFTAGSGVIDDDSWPAQLEQEVHQPVHNAAAGAWGVDQMVLRGEQLVPELRPKVMIISILGQDSLRNAFEIYGGGYKPYFVIDNKRTVLKGIPVPKVSARPMEIGTVRQILGHFYLVHWTMMRLGKSMVWIDNKYRYKQIHSDEVGVEISCLLMDRLVRLRDEYGLRVIVAMQYNAPESSGKEPPWYGPPVLECAKQRGFQTLDTYPPLKLLSERDPHRFVGLWLNEAGQLGHMSAAGNRFIAELFRDVLLKR